MAHIPPKSNTRLVQSILNKLSPSIIAGLLGLGILSYTAVTVTAIVNGDDVNFWGLKTVSNDDASAKHHLDDEAQLNGVKRAAIEAFIASLPAAVIGSEQQTRAQIEALIVDKNRAQSLQRDAAGQVARLEEQNHSLHQQYAQLDEQNRKLEQKHVQLQQDLDRRKDKFLNLILQMDEEISKWEGSINTKVNVEKKKEVFRLLQKILSRIGHYPGPVDADPDRSRMALIEYKKEKAFKNEKYWLYVTRETLIYMVSDYADILMKESRS